MNLYPCPLCREPATSEDLHEYIGGGWVTRCSAGCDSDALTEGETREESEEAWQLYAAVPADPTTKRVRSAWVSAILINLLGCGQPDAVKVDVVGNPDVVVNAAAWWGVDVVVDQSAAFVWEVRDEPEHDSWCAGKHGNVRWGCAEASSPCDRDVWSIDDLQTAVHEWGHALGVSHRDDTVMGPAPSRFGWAIDEDQEETAHRWAERLSEC